MRLAKLAETDEESHVWELGAHDLAGTGAIGHLVHHLDLGDRVRIEPGTTVTLDKLRAALRTRRGMELEAEGSGFVVVPR